MWLKENIYKRHYTVRSCRDDCTAKHTPSRISYCLNPVAMKHSWIQMSNIVMKYTFSQLALGVLPLIVPPEPCEVVLLVFKIVLLGS